jgi:hypothetical protein
LPSKARSGNGAAEPAVHDDCLRLCGSFRIPPWAC